MIERLRIPTEAGTFDALASGPVDGRPVLLLHGFPESAQEWEVQLEALGNAECRAVAPDQRGYSPEVRPPHVSDYRLPELVGDVFAIADQLGWARFDLVGHDWGAAIAWGAAIENPERLRSLVTVSVPHPAAFAHALREDEDQQQRSAYQQILRSSGAERTLLAKDGAALRQIFDWKIPAERIDAYLARAAEPGALTAMLNWYRAVRFGVDTPPVSVPTMHVWSTEDVAFGSTAALATEKHVTGPYRFEMLEGVSHWIPEEAGIELTRLIFQHLLANPA